MIIQSAEFLVQSAIPKISLQINLDLVFESIHSGIDKYSVSLSKTGNFVVGAIHL